MRILLSWCLYLFCIMQLPAQVPSFHTINYNIEDGLPSNECHDILQDSTGYIWIATDRGLARFDGYEFKTYGVQEGLTDIVCLDMVFDQEQNIWINTLSGKIFIYHQSLDSLLSYSHQVVIDSFLEKGVYIEELIVSKNDKELHIAISGVGFLIINNETGIYNLKRSIDKKEGQVFLLHQADEQWMITYDNRTENIEKTRVCNERIEILNSLYCQHFIEFKDKRYKGVFPEERNLAANSLGVVFNLDASTTLIHFMNINYFFGEKELLKIVQSELQLLDIISFESNGFLLGMHNRKGLKHCSSIENLISNDFTNLLNDVSITKIILDKEGNVWCSSIENGIYYLKKETVNPLDISDSNNSRILEIEVGENKIYFLEGKYRLFELENGQADLLLTGRKMELRSITYSEAIATLVVASSRSTFLGKDHKFEKIKCLNLDSLVYPVSSNKSYSFDTDELFFAHSSALTHFKNIENTQKYNSDYDEGIRIRVLAVEKINKDSFLLGTPNGLKIYGNKSIKELSAYPKELQLRINSIKKIGEWCAFGTQGNGLVFWDLKNEVIRIRKTDGILSNNIESLFIDDKENIYLSTKSGLSKVWFDDSNEIQIKNYTTFHGLPSNEVNDVDQMGDTIYIATGKGIATLVDDPVPAKIHQPFFTEIKVNNTAHSIKDCPTEFSHKENNIQLAYKTIDYKMQGKIPYRYKLNDGEWSQTNTTNINYPGLLPGDYGFQLQSKNRDDQWSKSITYDFKIRKAWWKTNGFLGICFLVIGFGSYLFYKNRTNQLKEKISVEREMRDLERSALQAQMNPHFIFNCLNSIQNFIMDNDKENAMEYLGKFARLIRQSLNASTSNKIPLDIEISMLQNYLELEKLRFKDKFDFKIELGDGIDPIEVTIPPLLIQPFIENAIIHGMKNKIKDGFIEIHFSKINANQVGVEVKDNGMGIQSNKIEGVHKSLGTSITAKRLAFNNQSTDDTFEIVPQSTSDGTVIHITIKI